MWSTDDERQLANRNANNPSSCSDVLTSQEARAAADAVQARAEKAAAAKQTYKEQAVSLARQLGALQRLRAAELTSPYTRAAPDRDAAAQVMPWESTLFHVHVFCGTLKKFMAIGSWQFALYAISKTIGAAGTCRAACKYVQLQTETVLRR